MININTQIFNFRNFLLSCWNDIDQLMEHHDWNDDVCFIDDWLQVNWEFLVERQLLKRNEFLNSYGISGQKRITSKDAKATHIVICKKKKDKTFFNDERNMDPISDDVVLIFQYFIAKCGVTYGWYPPFDYVKLSIIENNQHIYVQFNEIEFFLCSINEKNRVL